MNRKVIATFTHDRQVNGAAQCLRDAADAVDKAREKEIVDYLNGVWAINAE